jgi:uncharacterized protein involved in exopolysaccharide biosynthesis
MELNEAVQRIFRRHFALIAATVLAAVVVATALDWGHTPTYTATARFVLDAPDPQGQAQSAALADTARGIATGPATIAAALNAIGAKRDPLELAKHGVALEALGSSGVLSLSVQDHDPRVAARLANALAAAVIQTRLRITSGRLKELLNGLGTQIDDLTKQIVTLDAQIDKIDAQSATTKDPGRLAELRAKRDGLVQQRDYLLQQRVVLESERGSVAATDALRPEASVVDPAVPPRHRDPSRRPVDLGLGVLLGLVLGVGAASVLETLQPSVVGRRAIAEEMGAPLVGDLPVPPAILNGVDVRPVAVRVQLAAEAANVNVIELVTTDLSQDMTELAARLGESLGSSITLDRTRLTRSKTRPGGTGVSGTVPDPKSAENSAANPSSPNGQPRRGAVAVVPSALEQSELMQVSDLLAVTGWPLLGVITYRPVAHRPDLMRWIRRQATALAPDKRESRS